MKQQKVFKYGSRENQELEQRLNILVQETIPKEKYSQTARLQESLIKLRQAVFPFIYDPQLSVDYNEVMAPHLRYPKISDGNYPEKGGKPLADICQSRQYQL